MSTAAAALLRGGTQITEHTTVPWLTRDSGVSPGKEVNMLSLGSGEQVVDRLHSHVKRSVAHLLPDALRQVHSQGRAFLVHQVDFGRVVGETICVATGPSDEIVYAQRPKRFGLTRFVLNRQPEPCQSVVVILKAGDDGGYVLITAFVGQLAEPEPWDRNATPNSTAFWSTHALCWGHEEIVPGTVTHQCPRS